MKIYIYRWNNLRRINSTKNLITVQIVFKKWRRPYKYLNSLFLPQKPNQLNWFCRLFKNIELVFNDQDYFEGLIEIFLPLKFCRLIKVI